MMSRNLKSPLIYLGGKRRGADIITSHFPANLTEMVSPFFGGGGLEIRMAQAGVRVHGYDGDSVVAGFWEYCLRDSTRVKQVARRHYPIATNEQFRSLRDAVFSMPHSLERAAMWYAMNRASFGGISNHRASRSVKGQRFTRRAMHDLDAFRLPNLSVRWAGFHESLTRHPDLFAYLDPPYLFEDGREFYRAAFNNEKFFDFIKDRPNWIQSNTDNQLVRKLYDGFDIISVNWQYTMRKGCCEVLIFSKDLSPRKGAPCVIHPATGKLGGGAA
jgi:DNA adenine methylase